MVWAFGPSYVRHAFGDGVDVRTVPSLSNLSDSQASKEPLRALRPWREAAYPVQSGQ